MMKNCDYADIKIFYRIFPLDKQCWDYLRIEDKSKIFIRRLQELNDPAKVDLEPHFWEFNTDGVFYNTTQQQIYSSVVEDLLEDLTKGYSATITAYGQTGTGKSLTLAGLQFCSEDLGIAPRIAQDLFEYKKKLPPHIKMAVQISYVEFNEYSATDLLLKYPNEIDHWHVRDKMTKLKVRSKLDALKTLFLGEARKTFADTDGYMSHLCSSVLTFHVTTKNEEYSDPFVRVSRLHIIDMAGVDTVGNLASIFKTPNEIGRANVTKSDFSQLFLYLAEHKQNQTNIKERNNPLVYFLGEDLSARSTLRFIGHIRTSREDLPMTISMLRFGCLLKGIPPERKKIEKKGDEAVKMKQMGLKLEQLQKEKMLNSVLMNQDLGALNQERIEHLQTTVQQYLANTLHDITVMNVAEVGTVFAMFKELHHQAETNRMSSLMERKDITNANTSTGNLTSSKSKRGSKGSLAGRGSLIKPRKSSKLKVKDSIPEESLPVQSSDHRHSSTYGSKMENELSNRSPKDVTEKNNTSPKPSTTNRDSRVSKSGAGSSLAHMAKKKSKSLVNGKQSSVATMESISMQQVPENEEAWLEYRRQSTYKLLQTEYQANEMNIREAYNSYMDSVKKLQIIKDKCEKKRQEVLESTLVKNFNCFTRVDPETANLLETTEAICKENLDNAERELVDHQEMVLKTQTDFKIYLNHRKELKAQIDEGFETFSKVNYNILLIPPSEMAEPEFMSKPDNLKASKSSIKVSKSSTKMDTKLAQFKKMLEVEKNKNAIAMKKSKTAWK